MKHVSTGSFSLQSAQTVTYCANILANMLSLSFVNVDRVVLNFCPPTFRVIQSAEDKQRITTEVFIPEAELICGSTLIVVVLAGV